MKPLDLNAALAHAHRCVACGLCVPLCPTYRKLANEADSPRGRVMLMRALLEGTLAPEPGLVTHLDRCLACRACEAACPSGVGYGELLAGARARLAARGWRPRGLARWLPALLASPLLLGPAARRFGAVHPATGGRRGTVALFLGCAGRLADARTLRAAIFVLTRLGYEVRVPRGQGCCGAMHWHGGDPERAEALAQRNLAAFGAQVEDGTPVVFVASGCGAQLTEYGRHGAAGEAFAARTADVVSFLAAAQGWEGVGIAPLSETVAVHEPCSARNVLKNTADIHRLLSRIPGLRAVPLAGNDQCCGSAGLYFLAQPALARALRADKMRAVQAAACRLVVSTNYGCARWLKQGARGQGWEIEVLHPVVLLAQQMGFKA